jgi:hypothetical protein
MIQWPVAELLPQSSPTPNPSFSLQNPSSNHHQINTHHNRKRANKIKNKKKTRDFFTFFLLFTYFSIFVIERQHKDIPYGFCKRNGVKAGLG